MTPQRLHNTFNMPKLRSRAKKLMRSKYKKTITKKTLDVLWKDYFDIAILNPLLKKGYVDVDGSLRIEIVGRGIENKRYFKKNIQGLSNLRPSVVYKIEAKDNAYKDGKLIFKPSLYLRKKVRESLTETSTYYKIEK